MTEPPPEAEQHAQGAQPGGPDGTAQDDAAPAPAAPPAAAPGSYEEARAELVEVVRRLEAGGTTLEASLALWERGELLARHCQQWLDGARSRLDAAIRDTDQAGHSSTGG